MRIDAGDLPKPFGPYTLIEKFAGGGMAEIYLAETVGAGGVVKSLVIKTIHQDYSSDSRFGEMFAEEAEILSRLTHGNIVPIFDFGTVDETLYLAMEFIDGADVATLLDVCREEGIAIPPAVALHVGVGTSAALSCAHQAEDGDGKSLHIVHRDVSPQNILVGRSGEVKLCDFGLATRSVEASVAGRDAADEIKGKLKYLSPEQALGEPVDFRSDIFSLGVVLFELIVGHHPVPTESGVSVLRALTGKNGYPLTAEIAPWVPASVCAVLDRALRFEKTARFESAEEMRAALDRCRHRLYPDFSPESAATLVEQVRDAMVREGDASAGVRGRSDGSSSVPPSGTLSTSGRGPTSKPNRRGWAVVAAILLLMGVASWGVFRGGEPETSTRDTPSRPTDSSAGFDRQANEKRAGSDPTTGRDTSADGFAAANETGTERGEGAGLVEATVGPDRPGEGASASDAEGAAEEPTRSSSRDIRPARKVSGFGTVNINASPWADVTVDGVRYAVTPILGVRLRAGRHKIVLRNDALGVTRTRVITVKADETQTVVVEMNSEP